jgi:Uma2 family endonuclease
MATVLSFENRVELPLNIGSLVEFRRWTRAPDFPEEGRIDFLGDRIEVDMLPENLFCHGTLKTEISSVLHQLARKQSLGDVFVDSTRVCCPRENLSVEPDVVVVTHESLETGRVTLVPNATQSPDQFIELEGPPDLVVEIVSDSSIAKDLRHLPPLYFAAGIKELWLADARGDTLLFQIHVRGDADFRAQRTDNDGYQFSPTYDRSFRLDRSRNRLGHWQFDLVWR